MVVDSTLTNSPSHPSLSDTVSVRPRTDEIAVAVRHVSKMYPLYAQPSDRLKQSLWYALPTFLRGRPRQFYREFWALQDVSFEVKRGEALGIIGRNGSGKSTLLQIIAGTLAPTAGEVEVNGRVAALLELGSGFNPEFTGRENVYLNGAILGFSREEMDELFDEIAAFADIGQFIDQPVKLYSNGMFVRLAFAVQACVEPEILIVDEALSVGDVFFQMKCFRRFEKLQAKGVAIVFVSHDLGTVKQYCNRAILLDQGQLVTTNVPNHVINRYMELLYTSKDNSHSSPTSATWVALNTTADRSHLYSDQYRFSTTPQAVVLDLFVLDKQGREMEAVVSGEACSFLIRIQALADINSPVCGIRLKTATGVDVFAMNTEFEGVEIGPCQAGEEFYVEFSQNLYLAGGYYFLSASIGEVVDSKYVAYDHRQDFFKLYVLPSNRSNGIVNLASKISIYDRVRTKTGIETP